MPNVTEMKPYLNYPSIGTSLNDQEAVSLKPQLAGKKKKKKVKKAVNSIIEPNALFDTSKRN